MYPIYLQNEGTNVLESKENDDDITMLYKSKDSVPVKNADVKACVGIFGNDVTSERKVCNIIGHECWIGKIALRHTCAEIKVILQLFYRDNTDLQSLTARRTNVQWCILILIITVLFCIEAKYGVQNEQLDLTTITCSFTTTHATHSQISF